MHHLVFMAQSIHYETPLALGFRVTPDGIRQRCQGPRWGSHSGQIQTVQVIITHHVRLDAVMPHMSIWSQAPGRYPTTMILRKARAVRFSIGLLSSVNRNFLESGLQSSAQTDATDRLTGPSNIPQKPARYNLFSNLDPRSFIHAFCLMPTPCKTL